MDRTNKHGFATIVRNCAMIQHADWSQPAFLSALPRNAEPQASLLARICRAAVMIRVLEKPHKENPRVLNDLSVLACGASDGKPPSTTRSPCAIPADGVAPDLAASPSASTPTPVGSRPTPGQRSWTHLRTTFAPVCQAAGRKERPKKRLFPTSETRSSTAANVCGDTLPLLVLSRCFEIDRISSHLMKLTSFRPPLEVLRGRERQYFVPYE
jgi:hypothetical protein